MVQILNQIIRQISMLSYWCSFASLFFNWNHSETSTKTVGSNHSVVTQFFLVVQGIVHSPDRFESTLPPSQGPAITHILPVSKTNQCYKKTPHPTRSIPLHFRRRSSQSYSFPAFFARAPSTAISGLHLLIYPLRYGQLINRS